MWIVKGLLLGLVFFCVGMFLYFIFAIARFGRPNTAISLSAITGPTIFNPLFWLAFVCCLGLGCAIVGSWPVPVNPPIS